jgi:hypothetical protein
LRYLKFHIRLSKLLTDSLVLHFLVQRCYHDVGSSEITQILNWHYKAEIRVLKLFQSTLIKAFRTYCILIEIHNKYDLLLLFALQYNILTFQKHSKTQPFVIILLTTYNPHIMGFQISGFLSARIHIQMMYFHR